MDKLEKFILENRETILNEEPPDGHFDRFEEKLNAGMHRKALVMDRFFFLKVAAGLLIVLTVSVFLFDLAASRLFNGNLTARTEGTVPVDIRDAVAYYDQAASSGMGNIRRLACCGQDSKTLCTMAEKELKSLDANTTELAQAMREHPGDERIQAAMIRNQQMKETVVNHMVNGMSRVNR